MTRKKEDFGEIIKKDHAERKNLTWSGSFLEYLELVREKPEIYALAHRHMYDLISEAGIIPADEVDGSARSLKLWEIHRPRSTNFSMMNFLVWKRHLKRLFGIFMPPR